MTRSGRVVDRKSRGAGLIRLRPYGDTLLYRNGYTRRPGDVARILPDYWRRSWSAAVAVRRRLFGSDDSPEPDVDSQPGPEPELAVAGELDTVVMATRFALGAFAVGLLTAALAVPFDGAARVILQYVSTLTFVTAWAATSAGFLRRDGQWLSGACLTALKWWARIFVPVALINLVLSLTQVGPS